MKASFSILIIPAILIAFSIGGCNIINPSEQIPTYVHIDSIQFIDNPSIGTASQNLKHVYVSYNNQSLGAYDLPVTIPVLIEPNGVLGIGPGIDYNGLGGYTVRYDFLEQDTFHIGDNPTKTITIQPKTHYRATTTLKGLEDFESGTSKFLGNIFKDSLLLTNVAGEVFEGTGAGKFKLTSPNLAADAIFEDVLSFDPNSPSYVELNYKGTLNLEVGMIATGGINGFKEEYFVGFKPRADWNKVYVGLQLFVQQNPGSQFVLKIRALLPEGQQSGEGFIDNVKILTLR